MTAVIQSAFVIGLIWAPLAATESNAFDTQEQWTRSVEKKYTVKLEAPQHRQYCKATTLIEYYQSDQVAKVSGEISNDDCATSSGEYTISVRIRDEEGEQVDLDFVEKWQREDDQTVVFKREYAIGENVDLTRVRVKKTRCVCAESPREDDGGDDNDHQE